MKYSIYQVKENCSNLLSFCSLRLLKQMNHQVSLKEYKKVYSGEVPASPDIMSTLDHLFETFNVDHPDDYKARSMSVSDIVALHMEGKIAYYYCDDFGWELLDHLTEEDK